MENSNFLKYIFFIFLLLLIVGFFRIPSFQSHFFDNDEAIYGATAVSLINEGILYRDAVDHKPPLIYYIYEYCFKLFGVGNMLSIHIVNLILVMLTTLVIVKISFLLINNLKYSLWGGFCWACLNTAYSPKSLAANTETFFTLPLCVSLYFFLLSLKKKQRLNLFISGLFFGIAFFINFKGGIVLLVLLGFMCIQFYLKLKQGIVNFLILFRNISALVGGFFVVIIFFVLLFLAKGNLREFFEWGLKFNFMYVGEGGNFSIIISQIRRNVTQFFFVWAALIIMSYPFIKYQIREIFHLRFNEKSLILFWAIGSFIAVCGGFRFFPHYFVQILPPLCILSALGAQHLSLFEKKIKVLTFLVVWHLILSGVFFVLEYRGGIFLKEPHGEFWQKESLELARYVKKNTLKDDCIVVWGRLPEVYVLSNRKPGTRFVTIHLLVGATTFSWYHNEMNDVRKDFMPRSWDLFFQDLFEKKPKLFIDTSPASIRGYWRYPVYKYPKLMNFLKEKYMECAVVENCIIYKMKNEKYF